MHYSKDKYFCFMLYMYKTCVINDPLSQTHSPTSNYNYFQETFVLFWDILEKRMDTFAKIIINTGRDCGSAEWIIFLCRALNLFTAFFLFQIFLVGEQCRLCLYPPLLCTFFSSYPRHFKS